MRVNSIGLFVAAWIFSGACGAAPPLSPPTWEEFQLEEQKRAVKEYPSLGIAGSPLNRAFMRLYNEAKRFHREKLDPPHGGIMNLVRDAAESLRPKNHEALLSTPDPVEVAALGFPLQPTKFFVPFVNFDALFEEPMPGRKSPQPTEPGYHLTLAAHLFGKDEGLVPSLADADRATPVLKLAAQLAAASRAKDLHALDKLALPEGEKRVEAILAWRNNPSKEIGDRMLKGFADGLIEGLPQTAPVRLRAAMYLGKQLMIVYEAEGGAIITTTLSRKGDRFFVAEKLPEEYGYEAEWFQASIHNYLDRKGVSFDDLVGP